MAGDGTERSQRGRSWSRHDPAAPQDEPMGRRALIPRRSTLVVPALAAMLVLYILLAVGSLRGDSVTVDEFGHLPVGYDLLRTGDFHFCELNPPLMNLLSALPLAVNRVPPSGTGITIAPEDRYSFWVNGYDFMVRFQSDYQRIFDRARLVTVVLVGLLGLLLFLWGRRLVPHHAGAAGLLAAGLIWFSPNMLAHARLVTTDAGAAFFVALALFALHAYAERPGPGRAVAAGVALGAAELVKFHTLLLYPILGAVLLAEGWSCRGPEARRRILHGALIVAASVLVIQAGYLFHDCFFPAGQFAFTSGPMRALRRLAPGWAPVPLPQPYLLALDRQLADIGAGDPSYLLGKSYQGGRWYYFLVLLAVKTPLPELLLGGMALALGLRRRTLSQPGGRFLLFPAALFLVAFSLFSQKQIGLRMILPAAPLFALWAATILLASRPGRRRVWVLAILAAWFLVESVRAYPHYLASFNEVAGGPSRGYRLAVDSNLDWGQDLPALKQYLDANAIESIQLFYFGRVAPEIYGVRYTVPLQGVQPGLVAISATLLGRPYSLYDHGNLVQLPNPVVIGRDIVGERIATIGHTIQIYRVTAGTPGGTPGGNEPIQPGL